MRNNCISCLPFTLSSLHWHQEHHLERGKLSARTFRAQMSLWNSLVKKQTQVPKMWNLLMLINTPMNFPPAVFKRHKFSVVVTCRPNSAKEEEGNLFMRIKIYLWKHFQFATHNQSFMIFPRVTKERNIFSFSSFRLSMKRKFTCTEVWISYFLLLAERWKERRKADVLTSKALHHSIELT